MRAALLRALVHRWGRSVPRVLYFYRYPASIPCQGDTVFRLHPSAHMPAAGWVEHMYSDTTRTQPALVLPRKRRLSVFAKVTLLKPEAESRPGVWTWAYLSNNSRQTHFNVVHPLKGHTSVKTQSNVYFATTKSLPVPTRFSINIEMRARPHC